MFVKGGSPGPGRGHKKQKKLDGDLLDAIEQVVRTGMGAAELKDSLKAAGIAIRVKQLRGSDDSGEPILSPWVMDLFSLLHNLAECYLNKTGNPIGPYQIIKRMSRVCVNCDRLGTKFEDLEEVVDDNNFFS